MVNGRRKNNLILGTILAVCAVLFFQILFSYSELTHIQKKHEVLLEQNQKNAARNQLIADKILRLKQGDLVEWELILRSHGYDRTGDIVLRLPERGSLEE